MPIVEIKIWPGHTKAEKDAIIEKLTVAVVESMDTPRESVTVLITEVPQENWARGGKSFA